MNAFFYWRKVRIDYRPKEGNPGHSLDSSLCQWNSDSGFQSLVGFRIPRAVFRIPKPRILDSISKFSNFPGFGIPQANISRIPEVLIPLRGTKVKLQSFEIFS